MFSSTVCHVCLKQLSAAFYGTTIEINIYIFCTMIESKDGKYSLAKSGCAAGVLCCSMLGNNSFPCQEQST